MATRKKIEEDRIAESTKAIETQLAVQQSTIEQKKALSALKHRQKDSLKVRAAIPGVLQEVPVQVGQRVDAGYDPGESCSARPSTSRAKDSGDAGKRHPDWTEGGDRYA